jgi:hypothetical protein
VRELKNVVQRAFIVADVNIDEKCLPPGVAASPEADVAVGLSIEEARRRLILSTLERCGGNKKKAAELLGISLKTLYNRLGAYEEQPSTVSKQRRRAGRTAQPSTRGLGDGADHRGGSDRLQKTSVESGGEGTPAQVGLGERGHGDRG